MVLEGDKSARILESLFVSECVFPVVQEHSHQTVGKPTFLRAWRVRVRAPNRSLQYFERLPVWPHKPQQSNFTLDANERVFAVEYRSQTVIIIDGCHNAESRMKRQHDASGERRMDPFSFSFRVSFAEVFSILSP